MHRTDVLNMVQLQNVSVQKTTIYIYALDFFKAWCPDIIAENSATVDINHIIFQLVHTAIIKKALKMDGVHISLNKLVPNASVDNPSGVVK